MRRHRRLAFARDPDSGRTSLAHLRTRSAMLMGKTCESRMPAPKIEEFVIRPALDGSARPLIEFCGDHREAGYPPVVTLLGQALEGFTCAAELPVLDDFVWQCHCPEGAFEVSDDWGGLFVMAKQDHARVIEAVADALEKTNRFRRASPR